MEMFRKVFLTYGIMRIEGYLYQFLLFGIKRMVYWIDWMDKHVR